ncbi:MAG: hypothetical protein L3J18_02215 [Candidatus Brocadia sp.]|jgi:hypothetical protein|uniref:Uncharacterized protein n=1 Tax=Candidatus Brocadia fulgida TaxID=380242 RepID=A0A0M2V1R6_9BACT|nr:MAG: hypothetical protein BROFUL_00173 [Candidatus Brocadia fulgida]UJS21152.1 MAG: hypothetical protein L3J18_02215 [Candidatus Brocadia sp.]
MSTTLINSSKSSRRIVQIVHNPSVRKAYEHIENHYTEGMSILEPLKAGIKATDELIDEIVYRLYRLTEEEIEVVRVNDRNSRFLSV